MPSFTTAYNAAPNFSLGGPISFVTGHMNSPATIGVVRELVAAKGGRVDDIGRLSRGEFYYSTEGLTRPVKIRVPLCLSRHTANPPAAKEVIQKARTTLRQQLNRRGSRTAFSGGAVATSHRNSRGNGRSPPA